MGNCLSSGGKEIKSNQINSSTDGSAKPVSSARANLLNKRSSAMISMSDFMGIKKSDSIDNFYKIDVVIGRGAFGEVVKA